MADDNHNFLTAAKRALDALGHDVAVTDNGADVLAKLSAEQYDVLVLDMMMPLMNGGTVLRKLPNPHPAIIVSSAAEVTPEEVVCANVGRVLSKPYELPDLLQAIDDVLNESGLKDTKEDVPPNVPLTPEQRAKALERMARYERRKANGGAHA